MNKRTLAVSVPISYIEPGEDLHRPGRMTVGWESTDPTAVRLIFDNSEEQDGTDTVTWVVSRDMFADCLLNEPGAVYGQGDATLERGEVSFLLHLDGEFSRKVDITFMTNRVAELIRDSLMTVPRGEQETEIFEAGIDKFIEECLSQ